MEVRFLGAVRSSGPQRGVGLGDSNDAEDLSVGEGGPGGQHLQRRVRVSPRSVEVAPSQRSQGGETTANDDGGQIAGLILLLTGLAEKAGRELPLAGAQR